MSVFIYRMYYHFTTQLQHECDILSETSFASLMKEALESITPSSKPLEPNITRDLSAMNENSTSPIKTIISTTLSGLTIVRETRAHAISSVSSVSVSAPPSISNKEDEDIDSQVANKPPTSKTKRMKKRVNIGEVVLSSIETAALLSIQCSSHQAFTTKRTNTVKKMVNDNSLIVKKKKCVESNENQVSNKTTKSNQNNNIIGGNHTVEQDDQSEALASKLSRKITSQTYECMICYEMVKIKDHTWNCSTCFAIMHLKVILFCLKPVISDYMKVYQNMGYSFNNRIKSKLEVSWLSTKLDQNSTYLFVLL